MYCLKMQNMFQSLRSRNRYKLKREKKTKLKHIIAFTV